MIEFDNKAHQIGAGLQQDLRMHSHHCPIRLRPPGQCAPHNQVMHSNTPPDSSPDDTDLPPLIETPPGHYRHYKGGEYEVIGTVRHSETLEPMTLYRALYGARGLWVRPAAMFDETVEWAGVQQKRFAKTA